jgi:signal peptidase I
VIHAAVLFTSCLLLLRVWAVEPVQVPTGSMAPAFLGVHRQADCPCCGFPVAVGRHPRDRGDRKYRWYADATCPNCGAAELGLDDLPELPGDRLLVNKTTFAWRRPRRWEAVLIALFGELFLKRLIGLPGEEVEIRDGDIYIDGRLARKTLAECRAQHVPVFDSRYFPHPDGWRSRWHTTCSPHPLSDGVLHLDALDRYRWVVYRHTLSGSAQSQPIRDEYGYNGNWGTGAAVHDFLLECDVDIRQGEGHLLFGIRDGKDAVLAEVAVNDAKGTTLGEASGPWDVETEPALRGVPYRRNPGFALRPGRCYHVEMAFVDRRVTLAVDGREPFAAFDLPEVAGRPPVGEPVLLGARGLDAAVRNFRLYRDVHYTQAGRHGVGGRAVRLGPAEYFVLGDNSPQSDDSRFWPDRGALPADSLLGTPLVTWNRLRTPR